MIKLDVEALSNNWDEKNQQQATENLSNEIVNLSPLRGSGKTAFRVRVVLDKPRRKSFNLNGPPTLGYRNIQQGVLELMELELANYVNDCDKIQTECQLEYPSSELVQ